MAKAYAIGPAQGKSRRLCGLYRERPMIASWAVSRRPHMQVAEGETDIMIV